MWHYFDRDIARQELPERFTYPFCYTPHPLCVEASMRVMHYLESRQDWSAEIGEGKMFGVMIVEDLHGKVGYIAAFSGNIAHSNNHEYFVPAVYDLLNPEDFFVQGEAKISAINREIGMLEQNPEYIWLKTKLAEIKTAATAEIAIKKQEYEAAKQERELLRNAEIANDAELIKQSQFQKAEIKRLKVGYKEKISLLEAAIVEKENRISQLKEKRKHGSAVLQTQIFKHFVVKNSLGEERNLMEIFKPTTQGFPPAGAGECAAPKMLQYAYVNKLNPIAMAEFWWGKSPIKEIRKPGNYYPACIGKCKPILEFMLQGVDVEDNPLSADHCCDVVEVIYEDDVIIAVDKPNGIMSVPGKIGPISAVEIVKNMRPNIETLFAVHRLDMDTSGILLLAKNRETYIELQRQFAKGEVKKKYVAIIDGVVAQDRGEISLPLKSDYIERPRQVVCYSTGKTAITRFHVIKRTENKTLIEFEPLTGRTHQLRVHSAHNNGLALPILGDKLYGTNSGIRLHLHAAEIEFTHPNTGEIIVIMSSHNFIL